jgi:glycyl-tRNA synthetase
MARLDDLQDLLLRRGIIYPDSEVHGAIAGFYDYGSVGSEIKRRWEAYWRAYFLGLNPNFHEIETTNVMPEPVFKASGHLAHFFDPIVECSKCKTRVRADHILEEFLGEKFEGKTAKELNELIKQHKVVCPKCKSYFKDAETFTLMFPLKIGAAEAAAVGYLRPETAQGPYTAFKREFKVNRERLPLGLATIGRAFRNEISPRQLVIRQREFTQAELQIFFDPERLPAVNFASVKDYKIRALFAGSQEKTELKPAEFAKKTGMAEFFAYLLVKQQQFFDSLGLEARAHELSAEERAFYNKYHWDLEVFMPSLDKWVEVAGFHYRTGHDLEGHEKVSGTSMSVNVDGRKFTPHVLELSFGVDRSVFALLDNAFRKGKEGFYLALPRRVAPWDAGVYPLVNKESLPEKAESVAKLLRVAGFKTFLDDGGSIGRRYARADEIGVPFGITIDFDTLKDNTVTVRDRDSTKQERVKIEDLPLKLSK